jgi:polyphosphate kinase
MMSAENMSDKITPESAEVFINRELSWLRFAKLAVGRLVERGRIHGFENDDAPEYFIGLADWMKRDLDRRVETIALVSEPTLVAGIEAILTVAVNDNYPAWDLFPDRSY